MPETPTATVATASKRRIFTYERDGANICVDPSRLHLSMRAALEGEQVDELIRQALPDPPADGVEVDADAAMKLFVSTTAPAQAKLAAATRTALGISELKPDGSGMTDAEAFEIWMQFSLWLADHKATGEGEESSPTAAATEPVPE